MWSVELSKLPDLTWGDVYNYLINTTSTYTKEKLKAYKLLEAYNFFVCGHVQDVFYNAISEESSFYLKSKVSRSYRFVILAKLVSLKVETMY